ncbi:hypothetical protein GALMADRAFT_245275 [Galerina marginata CBS 339.88]|uniref:Uncharacterized protein n=1 Tax=Galerina marginata (strain CBS 339.88) TaxID=685588 RepID=A0A067T769_GALM3|nr:hypothetical protein GALMADRAFT_245275 [Galerina marginata CBS 339.88]
MDDNASVFLSTQEDIIHEENPGGHLGDTPHESLLCPDCAGRVSELQRPLVSPLEHLLSDTSRHLPSPEEEVQVRHVIDEVKMRISEIDSTTKRIKLLLDELTQERAKIQDFGNKHRVMVAPVWDLPPEILSYIFILCLPRRPPQEIKRSSLKRSFLLSRVNRHWRNVAKRTPQLWTTIYLNLKSFSDEEGHVCMPKIFLERSGACPLSIGVNAKEHSTDILDFIIPLSLRWQRISFDTTVAMLQALHPIENRIPLLRMLEIKNAFWSDNIDQNPLAYFSKAPLLQHVAISCSFLPTFRVLPWHQLTTWDSPVQIQDFPRIFELAPNLEECFIQPMRLVAGHTIPENENSVAHNLTSLHISTGIVINIGVQLQHLPHLPALRRLFLYFDRRVTVPHSESNIVTFFSKSGGQLETLTLGVGLQVSILRNCLTHTPLLTTFHIHRITTDALLELLILPNTTGASLLPKLEILRISGKIYFTPQAVLKIIRSRWEQASAASSTTGSSDSENGTLGGTHARCLRSVHILPPRHDKFDARSKKELLDFNQQGFDVQIRQLDRTAFLNHHTPFTSTHPPAATLSSA